MVAPVPDDEDPRVVAVQAEPVGAVVDAVVGRGVEHPVQRAQARDQLGVDPVTMHNVWTLVQIFSEYCV